MDTSQTSSYVALKLTEIQKRFEELGDEDLAVLSIEEPEQSDDYVRDEYNPYNRC